jgi:hypothetical protein
MIDYDMFDEDNGVEIEGLTSRGWKIQNTDPLPWKGGDDYDRPCYSGHYYLYQNYFHKKMKQSITC